MAYYVVRGENGVIIHYNFYKAQACQRCIHKSTIRKIEDFDEAEQMALEHLRKVVPGYIPIPEHIKVDQMVTRAMLDKRNGGYFK